MKKRKTPDLEKYLEGKKRRFVNYTQEAENPVPKPIMIWWTVW